MNFSLLKKMCLVSCICFSQLTTAWAADKALTQPEDLNKPSFAINAEPIWLILGGMGLKFEYFISDTASVGVGGMIIPGYRVAKSSTYADDSYILERSEILVGSNIMLTGTLNSRGLYINPAVGYLRSAIKDYSSSKLSGELSAPMARLTMGYQWILVEHLRLAAGGGLMAVSSSSIVVKDNAGNTVLSEKSSSLGGLALDLQIGYVF